MEAEKPTVEVAATSVEEELTEEPEVIEEKPEGEQVKEGVEKTEEGRSKMAFCYSTGRWIAHYGANILLQVFNIYPDTPPPIYWQKY